MALGFAIINITADTIHLNLQTKILAIIFWNFAIFQSRSDSPQVKQNNLISSIANLVHKLPHELLNDVKLMELGNIRKISNLGRHIALCLVSLQERRLCQQQLILRKNRIPNFSSPVQFYWIIPFCSKYFVQDCLSRHIFGPNLAQSPSNFNFVTFFITPKHFYELQQNYKASQLR